MNSDTGTKTTLTTDTNLSDDKALLPRPACSGVQVEAQNVILVDHTRIRTLAAEERITASKLVVAAVHVLLVLHSTIVNHHTHVLHVVLCSAKA